MYLGKMTKELEELYGEYEKKFGILPDGYDEIDYAQKHYKQFVKDIKIAIQTGKEIPDLYPIGEDDWY